MIEIAIPEARTGTDRREEGGMTSSRVSAQSVGLDLGMVGGIPDSGKAEAKAIREANEGWRGGTLAPAKSRMCLLASLRYQTTLDTYQILLHLEYLGPHSRSQRVRALSRESTTVVKRPRQRLKGHKPTEEELELIDWSARMFEIMKRT